MLGRLFFPGYIATVGVAMVAGAIFFFVEDLDRTSMARESDDWPSVPGIVMASEITSHTSIGAYGADTIADYRAAVSYGYKVQGRDYESDRVTFGSVGSSYRRAQEVANRYPVSKDVAVFYDPADPAQAVLEAGKERSIVNSGVGSAAFALVGMFLIWFGLGYFQERTPVRCRPRGNELAQGTG